MGKARYKQYYKDGYYHIYNRGVGRQDVFRDKQDYLQYLKRLRTYRDEYGVTLICYCLMPNHIHLIARQNTDNPVYKFVQSLHTSYGMYFNKKHKRVGSLWQDRFKQKNIEDESYLLYLSYYIHLNPLLDGVTNDIDDYQWSSYLDYAGRRSGTLCDKTLVLQGQSSDEYTRLIMATKETIKNHKEVRHLIEDCP